MLTFDLYNDPFSFERLLSLPALGTEPSSAWQTLDLDEPHFDEVFKPPDAKSQALQQLNTDYFHLQIYDVPLPEIESSSVSSAPSAFNDTAATIETAKKDVPEFDENIWTLPDVIRPDTSATLTSWDHFLHPSRVEPGVAYLSEAGPARFEAALEQALTRVGKHLPSKVARPDKLIFALFELGCGRQSGLFQWDNVLRIFGQRSVDFGLPGTSQDVQDAFIEDFITTGSTIRRLVHFIEEDAAPFGSQHVVIALSSAVSVAIYATMRFVERQRHGVRSLLQLQELFHRPRLLFKGFAALAKIMNSGSNACETIARLLNETQQLAGGAVWLEDILSEVVVRAATPWLEAMTDVVGLSPPSIHGPALNDGGSASANGGVTIPTASSHVLPSEISHLVMECETSLQLLQTHEPDHPILTSTEAERWPSLSWECSWEALEKLQNRADEYERSMKRAVQKFAQGSLELEKETGAVTIETSTDDHVTQDPGTGLVDLDSNKKWNQHLGIQQAKEDDKLDHLVSTAISKGGGLPLALKPPLNETLYYSVSPWLKAQHRLLSSSLLHLLFKKHGFRSHLALQHRFQLLADGSFASRLSLALFDPEQASGEGRRKSQGKTGLRLQTRDTWPPASSELRLVLMGILAESSTQTSFQGTGPSKAQDTSLSDAMSFAIRDLSDVELEKCRDADSIYALDFLRLQYKPPSALLEAILTSSSSRKYDRMFKHLLRLLRMRSVALSLIRSVSSRGCDLTTRSDHKFRVEMQFFISTLAEYSTNVAIGAAWARFEGLVDKVEKCLDRSDFDGAIAIAGSLQRLTDMHDEALDRILRALCLDRKQAQARTLLEDVFGLVLRFAAMVRNDDAKSNDYDEKTKNMHQEFRKQVGRFTRYLQAQSDASISGGGAGNGEALAFEQLLVRLNMFGYYS